MDPPTPHLLSSAGALHISVVLSLEPQHIYLTLTLQGCCEVFSGINLMLYKSFVSPIMTNLQQLPEVDAGLNQPPTGLRPSSAVWRRCARQRTLAPRSGALR